MFEQDIVVNGISMMFLVLGVVQFIKDNSGIKGTTVKAVSMLTGVFFGILFGMMQAVPSTPSEWATLVLYGITVGLSASGIYDLKNENKSS